MTFLMALVITNNSSSVIINGSSAFSTNINGSNGTPNPQCDSGKNRRPGDRAKPDFDKLLGVGAWGRASGSRVEAHSTTPSARVACPWGANRRYDTKDTQTVLIAPLLLCSVLCILLSVFCLSAFCLDATEVALPTAQTNLMTSLLTCS